MVSVTIVTISVFLTFSLFLNQYFHKIRLLPISFLFCGTNKIHSDQSWSYLSTNPSERVNAELGPKVRT